jgi:thiol-disulfide isomerase/thioredoxin
MRKIFPFVIMTLIVLVSAGCTTSAGLLFSNSHPATPQAEQINQYLTQQANSTPIPTGTSYPGQEITQTAEADKSDYVEMTATDPMTFQLVSGKYQLVEIMAYWCAECRDLNPILKGLEKQWGDKINFVYLDVDDPLNINHLQQLSHLNVVPEVILLDGQGKVVKDWVGPPTRADLTAAFSALP